MSIENVRVRFIRPKGFHDLEKWIEDDNNIYIGRAGIVYIKGEKFPKNDSIFHNPFKIDDNTTREEVIQKYKIYITDKLENEPELVHELIKLKNKNLGCWCYPELCHGNILLELIDYYDNIN